MDKPYHYTIALDSCTDGQTGMPSDHRADGWLISPEGKPICTKCRFHANVVMEEYLQKLGEVWSFGPYA